MVNLILASEEITTPNIKKELFEMLDKEKSSIKVLFLFTEDKKSSEGKIRERFVSMGLDQKNIEGVNVSEDISTDQLQDYDIIYVYGGNTYTYLDRIRRTKLDEFIKNHVHNGKVFIGTSAGSIIAGPNIINFFPKFIQICFCFLISMRENRNIC